MSNKRNEAAQRAEVRPLILEGVDRFLRNGCPVKKEQLSRLASGQSPKSCVLACSDSRLDTSLITDSDPGEIFCVRNAGNMVPAYAGQEELDGSIASIEFAVTQLEVEEIVVLGHYGCGLVGAAIAADADGEGHLSRWVRRAREQLKNPEGSILLDGRAACELHVVKQMGNLKSYPFIRERLGRLSVYGMIFDFQSGGFKLHSSKQGFSDC